MMRLILVPGSRRREEPEEDLQTRWAKASRRVTTRKPGEIPGCKPVEKDEHMVPHVPGSVDEWLRRLREDIYASRAARGHPEFTISTALQAKLDKLKELINHKGTPPAERDAAQRAYDRMMERIVRGK